MDISFLYDLKYIIRSSEGAAVDTSCVNLVRDWSGDICRLKLVNKSSETLCIKEVVLFTGDLNLGPDTRLYGEGYNMLSQYAGTLGSAVCIGSHSDAGHYKIPQAPGFFTVYNLALLSKGSNCHILMAFSSCRRFSGEFRFGNGVFEVVLDTECLRIGPGECWELEEFFFCTGEDRESLFEKLANRINSNHPKLPYGEVPTGWCSWYCYGPKITVKDIFDNLDSISRRIPDLKFIQIDDGYQPYMGDWLEPNPSFSGDIKNLCLAIKEKGFEPAIWVAPFIAVEESKLFREHPDWFVKDEKGEPLRSDRVSFGGWRGGKWYMLDGTHPGAQEHLRTVFRTIRQDWKCRYFKLDANMWGALHGGKRYDRDATRIEAYRRGMKAILEGVGNDSFILGCNAPMWPSLGVVHGMRVSNDINRSWQRIESVARQVFWRNWQHDRLWINDPDAVVLENKRINLVGPDGKVSSENATSVTDNEFVFHATFIYASGGMVLSGDKITELSDRSIEMLKKLIPPTNVAARFDDATFRVGRIYLEDCLVLCLFNWNDQPENFEIDLPGSYRIKDFWTGNEMGTHRSKFNVGNIEPHSARIFVCENECP